MIRLPARTPVFILTFGLAMALVGFAWAGAPGYYATQLVGDNYVWSDPTPATTNSYGETLLPDGTVIGVTVNQPSGAPPPLPQWVLASWNTSGAMTTVYNFGTSIIPNAYGDASGRYVAVQNNVPGVGGAGAGVYLYSGGTLTRAIPAGVDSVNLLGMTQNGLAAGWTYGGAGFAYDVATSTNYAIGPTNSWVQAVGGSVAGNGYVVGGDGTNYDGFLWSQSNQSYTQFPALAAAQGVSNNGQLVAGLTQSSSPNAAVYSASGTSVGTYWAGEATGVNNNGVVIGDTVACVYNGGDGSTWDGHAMAYVPGFDDPQGFDLNTYAPSGVTFNVAQAVNDAGQILVWSNGWSNDIEDCKSYLLTPAIAGDANLDGKVDINDLTIVLAHYNQTGASWGTGDFTGSGTVDINDLTIVLAHYGQSSGSSAGMAAVPEPGMLVLLAVGLIGLLTYAWRKQN